MVRMQRQPPRPARRRVKKKAASAYHHGDLEKALVEAALDVVGREGIDAVKVKALTTRLGVSDAAAFRHFANKKALLVAAAEEGGRRMMSSMLTAAEGAPNPLEAQRAQGIAYVRFAVEHRGAFLLVSHPELVAASPLLQQLDQQTETARDEVLGRHREGRASRHLIRRSAGALAGQALVYGLARMITDGLLGPISADDAEVLAAEILTVLGEGLGPAPAARRD